MLSKRQIKYFKSLQLKKYRNQERLFLVEGAKGVEEALKSGYQIHTLLGTKPFLEGLKIPEDIPVFEAKEADLIAIGTFKSNNSAIAILELPVLENMEVPSKGIHLVLDDVRDPGNLGTIIRIADWYGIQNIFCSETTADVYNPKVISATMGSFTRVNVSYLNLQEFLPLVQLPIYGTHLSGESIYTANLEKDALILMGNESQGIRSELMDLVTEPLLIPRVGGAESLNVGVATAVVLDNFFR